MTHPFRGCWTVLLYLALGFSTLNSQTTLRVDQPNARYATGGTVIFTIDGAPNGIWDYRIFRDAYLPEFEQGTVQLNTSGSSTLSFQTTQPGSVFCELTNGSETLLTSALVDPFSIDNVEDAPIDFDAYWQTQLNQLATFPIDPQLTFVEAHDYADTYLVQLNGIDHRAVYGYLTVPHGSGPFPATVSFPSFGNNPTLVKPEPALAERANQIHFNLTVFPTPPTQTDPDDIHPNDITNRDSIFYRFAVLAGVRAVDYLLTRPDVLPDRISAMGVSQGGGLGNMLAGLDQRIATSAVSNPIFGRLYGFEVGGASAFPFFLPFAVTVPDDPDFYANARSQIGYYDGANFSRRFTGPSFWTTGYRDRVTPSSTVLAMFNALPGPKVMVHDLDGTHDSPDEYWQGRHAFLRRYAPESAEELWPFEPDHRGYGIYAGEDRSMDLDEMITLTATYDRDDQPFQPSIRQWRQAAGPGTAQFTTPNADQTAVTFTEAGRYRLEFWVEDDSLGAQDTYVTLHDDLYVDVLVPDTQPPLVTLVSPFDTTDTNFVISLLVSEPVTGFDNASLIVNNGSVVAATPQGNGLLLEIAPNFYGDVAMVYPAGGVMDAAGNENPASNLLKVFHSGGEVSSVAEADESNPARIFPVPGKQTFTLQTTHAVDARWTVFDNAGRTVAQPIPHRVNAETYRIDLPRLPAGSYRIHYGSGMTTLIVGN